MIITSHQKQNLPYKSVHIQCLDSNDNVTHNASGFVVYENDKHFLYTCWHTVTGYNYPDIVINPNNYPERKSIRVNFQENNFVRKGFTIVGGHDSIIISLYKENEIGKPSPVWQQQRIDKPHPDLNAISIAVPKWFDLVKIPLPSDVSISSMQVIGKKGIYMNTPQVGDKLYIVGFPYGYSALGEKQPTPIVLTRHLAALHVADRAIDMLMDGPCAPGMSGGPVFVEGVNGDIYLTGVYTGLIYPDYQKKKNDKITALGTYSNMIMWWKDVNKDL